MSNYSNRKGNIFITMINKSYKYRIYPNEQQKVLIHKTFGCSRFIYNWGLNQKIQSYKKDKSSLSCINLINQLTNLKEENIWLKDVNSQALQMSLRNLDNAFTKFFREKSGFPNFKSKKNKQSFQSPQKSKVNFNNNTISVLKIQNIKAKLHRKFEGKIKTVTISKTCSNKYYCSVLVELNENYPKKPEIKLNTSLGIDVGLKDFATFSNGEKVQNPKYLKNKLDKVRTLHYKLSKKIKGSNRRNKAKIKLARLYETISNRRDDFLHKLTYKLTHENQVNTICIEDLNIKGMVKNHKLAQSISDVSWYKFFTYLSYKCDLYGKNLVKIGRFEASSKICNVCGYYKKDLELKDRELICPQCGTNHDRDINASKNIRDFALQKQNLVGMDKPESTLRENASLEAS